MIQVTQTIVYPVKSCGGIRLDRLPVDVRGPCDDRRWMIVDASGQFISQRTHARLSLVRIGRGNDGLVFDAPGMQRLAVSTRSATERIVVEVWRHRGEATTVSPEADAWLSEYLGCSVRLVACADDMHRLANRDWVDRDVQVGFADAYPILLISEASLQDLNERLPFPIEMSRFRPNLVVAGCDPFAEDDWKHIRIGALEIDVVKPCDRCVVTTIDPRTAEKGREPLATLARFRRSPAGVLFGQNCVARSEGTIKTGDEVEIIETGAAATRPPDFHIMAPRD